MELVHRLLPQDDRLDENNPSNTLNKYIDLVPLDPSALDSIIKQVKLNVYTWYYSTCKNIILFKKNDVSTMASLFRDCANSTVMISTKSATEFLAHGRVFDQTTNVVNNNQPLPIPPLNTIYQNQTSVQMQQPTLDPVVYHYMQSAEQPTTSCETNEFTDCLEFDTASAALLDDLNYVNPGIITNPCAPNSPSLDANTQITF